MELGRAVVAAALGLSLARCGAPAEHAPGPTSGSTSTRGLETPPELVGRASCEGCHREEAAAWRGSHHDLAMQPANADTVLGDFDDATYTYGDVTSVFFKRDDTFWVRTDDATGSLQDFPVEYVFGVDPLQQYLVPFPDGRYQVLSLCWDSRPVEAGGQRWFHIYADGTVDHDDPLHWTGAYQNWNFMCAECHSTKLDKGYSAADDRYATTWQEIDVSCEACHGPGSRHVDWARLHELGKAPDLPHAGLVVGLNDSDGGTWQFDDDTPTAHRTVPRADRSEVETCGRCHSRRGQIHGTYRHGVPLADTHRVALLTEDLYHADGQILDEVYVYGSFLQSRMYHEGVSCKDCHDVHTTRVREDGNALCSTCHMGREFDVPAHHHHDPLRSGAVCVNCHMVSRNYMVVDPRRDHSMRVPRPDLTLKIGTPNACNDCHTDRDAAWSVDAVRTWFPEGRTEKPHWSEGIHAGRTAQADAPYELTRIVEDPEVPGIVRATAVELMARWLGPRPAPLLDRLVLDPDPLVRRSAVSALENVALDARLATAQRVLDDPIRTVRIAAGRVLAPVPPAQLPGPLRSAVQQVVDEYIESQWFNADRGESHANLGGMWMQRGDLARAREAFERSLALMPGVSSYVNLADLNRAQGNEAEAERLLRAAVEFAPDEAAPHHALGLTLIRVGRRDEAFEQLRRAAELAPDVARYAYVYGVGLFGDGDMEGGLAVLEQAHRRVPADVDILLALVAFNRDTGRIAAAIDWARKLVYLDQENPAYRDQLAALEAL